MVQLDSEAVDITALALASLENGASFPRSSREMEERTQMVNCPLCDAAIDVDEEELDEGDVLTCEECGTNLTVNSMTPLELVSEEEGEADEDDDDFEDDYDDEQDEAEEEEDEDDDEE